MLSVFAASVERTEGALLITVSEHAPFALWCTSSVSTTTPPTDCYFIDTHGRAYEEAPQLMGATIPRFVVEGKNPQKNEQMLAEDLVVRFLILSKTLNDSFGFGVVRATYTENHDVIFMLSTGAEIRFADKDTNEQVASNITSILTSKEFNVLKNGHFEYIDLRFGNKVFVEKDPVLDSASSTRQATSTY